MLPYLAFSSSPLRFSESQWDAMDYEVCSESNAQGEITSMWIIVGTWLFQDFLRPPRCEFEHIVCSSPATPSRFVIRLPWDNERSAGFDFTSLKPKNVRRSRIRQIGRLTNHLDAFAAIKSPRMRHQLSLFLRHSTKTGPGVTLRIFLAWKLAGT